MQKLNYDYYNNIEVPTFVLSNVYHHHIGVINNIDIESIQYSFNMNARQEVSFDIYKELNGEKCDLWDKIIDLKYVYIPEHDEYYVLAVSTDDSDNTVKHCSLTSAGEYELSNKIIRSLEINTESDILRNVDDASKPPNPPYAPNVLCNFDDPDNSILHRALKDKAPDWSVAHCDETIAHIQRTFTVTNQKIYDFLTTTLAKEYDCLFQFDSVNRTISCYDLLNICEDCGERGEFVYECPNCGSKKIHYGYGKNTNIFITYNNFSEKITRDGDEGAVKNCFHVTGGDDYMSSTIRNINPNGSPYIYNFSQQDYEDMPPALVEGLEAYQAKYDELYEPYQEVTAKWYDAINNYYFYKTSMMPRSGGALWEAEKGYNLNDETYVKTLASWAYLKCVKAGVSGTEEFDASNVLNGQIINDGTVQWQVCKNIITPSTAEQSYNDIVTYFQSNQIYFLTSIPTTLTQVNNEVINISQLQINNLYKVDVVSDGNNKVEGTKWYGRLKVTNSGNAEDTYKSDVTLEINLRVVNALQEYESYMEDKVVKRINRADKTFINLYEIPLDENDRFKALLTQYGLDSLSSFSKSYQNCIDVLIANGIKDENSTYMGWEVYDPIYLPTYNRKTWVDEELAKREATVKKWENLRDDYRKAMDDIQNQLDLTNFLSDDLLKTFYNYIREDTYTNSNYISTGLSDGEVINNAKELLKVAEKELKKASELQVTLNDTIKNLLNTDEFKNYKDKYNLGDFIFVECDGDDWEDDAEKNRGLYRLRLISASYSFGSPGDINFTFSNVTKVQNFFSDAQSVINSAQTISGSYNAVVHQVKNNSDTTDLVNTWTNEGLESAKSIIANNNNEEVTMGEYGIYAKEYDDIKDEYSPEQLRITHNNITFTDDNWETAALAIGKNTFRYYNTDVSQGEIGWITKTDYGVNAKFLEAGYVIGGQIIGSEVVSKNYQVADPSQGIQADGSYINLDDGSFTLAGGGLIGYRNSDGTYYLNYNGNFTGIVDVDVGSELGVWTVGADGFYSGTSVLKPSDIAVTGNIRAADFYVGTSTTTTLSSILSGKQDTLIPGTNITIDPTTNTISASSGTEVEANPSGTPTDTLTTIEIDNTIYDIDGGTDVEANPSGTATDTLTSIEIDNTIYDIDGGTDVEANPVETATDTLTSIKIDNTVYDLAGSSGSVDLYHGVNEPVSSLGDDDDIYLRMKSTPLSTNKEIRADSGSNISGYNQIVYPDRNEFNFWVKMLNGGTHSYQYFHVTQLTVGKTYRVRFIVTSYSGLSLSTDKKYFGMTVQETASPIDMTDYASEMVTDGEFVHYTEPADFYYQSFHEDTTERSYEFEFTATQTTMYMFVYGDKVTADYNLGVRGWYVTELDETNEIEDVYYKVNNQWSLYNRNVTLYNGLQSPSQDLGNDDDIYIQLATEKGSNISLNLNNQYGSGAITGYSATGNLDNSWNASIVGQDNWEYHTYIMWRAENLEVGKEYTVTFGWETLETPPLYGMGELFGITIQHNNTCIDMRNYSSELVEDGEFKYFENQASYGEFWYQSFHNSSAYHNYEFTFVAKQTTEYIGYYLDRISGGLTTYLRQFGIGLSVATNEIKDIYYKLDDSWIKDERGIYEPFIGATASTDGEEGLVPQPLIADKDKFLKGDGTWATPPDTTYDVFESPETAQDTGVNGLVPAPTYADVQANKVLQADGTWVLQSGGSGNVADVYVNGTSALDENDIAQIFSHEEITEISYDNLPSTKFSDNHMYLIKEAGTPPTGEYYNPVIYSEEEREIGVWMDNKPLYAKSFTLSSQITVSASSWTNTDLSLADVEKFVNGYAISDDGTFQGSVVVDKSNDVIQLQSTRSSTSYVKYLTVFYTKTIDVAGSGQYNHLGVPTIHYSTDEQVIGTWIDGKPIYQKTYSITEITIRPAETVVPSFDISNIDRIINAVGMHTQYQQSAPLLAFVDSNQFYLSTSLACMIDTLTLQYTKTTD